MFQAQPQLMKAGISTTKHVKARYFLKNIGDVIVKKRTRLCKPFKSLKDVKAFVYYDRF